MEYLIWSEEHGGWWKPGSTGYTRRVVEAGRYSLKEAQEIVGNAKRYLSPIEPVNEIMFPAPPKSFK